MGHLKSSVFHLRLRALPMPKASAPAPTPTPDVADPVSYEAALQELEQLVARIESGQLPLDQMLAGYQRGAQLLAFCRSRLEAVQDQIKVLDDGVLQPWSQE
jgi:exodeoxyribonuclease VII small subunit